MVLWWEEVGSFEAKKEHRIEFPEERMEGSFRGERQVSGGRLGVRGWWNGPFLGFKSQLCVDSALNIRRSPFHRMTCDEKMNTPPGHEHCGLTRSIGFLR